MRRKSISALKISFQNVSLYWQLSHLTLTVWYLFRTPNSSLHVFQGIEWSVWFVICEKIIQYDLFLTNTLFPIISLHVFKKVYSWLEYYAIPSISSDTTKNSPLQKLIDSVSNNSPKWAPFGRRYSSKIDRIV